MPSGIKSPSPDPKNPGGVSFEAVYEAPFGGVNSSLAPMDIPASDFVQCDNMIVQDGVLVTVSPNNPIRSGATSVFQILPSISVPAGAYIAYVFNCANYLCGLDQQGNTYTYAETAPGVFGFSFDQANPFFISNGAIPFGLRPAQVINNLAYIPVTNTSTNNIVILVYNPTIAYASMAAGYSVGRHLNVLSGYLIQTNIIQPSDTPVVQPSRFSWSGAFNYTEFDPSVDQTAGYNTLTDSSSEIVGMFSMANVGYILRTEGMTQASPTGISLQPFDFTSFWTSKFGIGAQYSDTVAQFGNFGFFVSESDIFVFNGAAPQGIAKEAKTAIYSDINALQLTQNVGVDTTVPRISGDVAIYYYQNPTPAAPTNFSNLHADIYYHLAFALIQTSPQGLQTIQQITCWMFSVESAKWTRCIVDRAQLLAAVSEQEGVAVTSVSGAVSVVTVDYSEHVPNTVTLPAWQANTFYNTSGCIIELDGYPVNIFNIFKLTQGGLSGGAAPAWDYTVGSTTTDGAAIWTNIGHMYFVPGITPQIGTTWQPSSAYNVGDSIYYVNQAYPGTSDFILECTVAGTSDSSIFNINPTFGQYVFDGTVTWQVVGRSVQQWENVILPYAPLNLTLDRQIEDSNSNIEQLWIPSTPTTFPGPTSCGISGAAHPAWNVATNGYTSDGTAEPLNWLNLGPAGGISQASLTLAPFAYINLVGTYNTSTLSAVPFATPFVLSLGNNFNHLWEYVPPTSISLVSKQEEFKIGRQPTIRRVVVKARGAGTLNITVSNRTFSPIIVNDSTKTVTYTSSGMYTGEDPQLTITSPAFKGTITKYMMVGEFRDGGY